MKPSFLLVAVPALLLAGCAHRTPVGKWDMSIDAQGKKYPAVVDIKADNTATWVITVPGQQTGLINLPEFKMNATGTWKTDGKTFTTTMTDIKLDDSAPDLIKAGFEMVKKQIVQQIGQSRTATLAYRDSGSMELTTPDGVVTTLVPHKG
ncbi:MAG: hypothetical protein KF857_06320 [Fimbriimonadaceae bacterium]|nr:hypothetical protein [Fimbriimonadaceae bacterium]